MLWERDETLFFLRKWSTVVGAEGYNCDEGGTGGASDGYGKTTPKWDLPLELNIEDQVATRWYRLDERTLGMLGPWL